MAKTDAVWGIDIGNCSLKAVRCRRSEDSQTLEALAFDFIEYRKILTQPDANPEQLVAEALEVFLSRNDIRGDKVAVSVSGQNGLARFIKLPPVESKKIPDMVKYEARQQIPFELQDVVWDYQRLGLGAEEEGVMMDTEIGLFAMKRDVAYRALEPFNKANIDVDVLQLTPLALYNYIAFDQLRDLPSADEYDPDNPPASVVVLSMGTDSTDLVVTNGFRVWQRSIPIGGNNFTKALTKELKLTFAKAEHLKRNVSQAQDPKTVFQAMRPVFNQFLTEIQRSIGFFTNLDRNAEISKIIALGNAMKLPGLRKYLSQSLGYEVVRGDEFQGLVGPEVVGAPAFKDNQMCFGVAYGLALQGMGDASLGTNLMPAEILKDRLIARKKPWALASVAMIILGLTIGYVSATRALSAVGEERFGPAERAAAAVVSKSNNFKSEASARQDTLRKINDVGRNLVGNVEGRIVWTEFETALAEALAIGRGMNQPADTPLNERYALFLDSVDVQPIESQEDLTAWFDIMKEQGFYRMSDAEKAARLAQLEAEGALPAPNEKGEIVIEPEAPTMEEGEKVYLVEVDGWHLHNSDDPTKPFGATFLRDTFIRRLENLKFRLPASAKRQKIAARNNLGRQYDMVSMKDFGISCPSLINPGRPVEYWVAKPEWEEHQKELEAERALQAASGAAGGGSGEYGEGYESEYSGGGYSGGGYSGGYSGGDYEGEGGYGGSASGVPEEYRQELKRFDFTVQFVWKVTPPSVRDTIRAEREEAARLAAEQAAQNGDTTETEPAPAPAPTTTPAAPPATPPTGATPPGGPTPPVTTAPPTTTTTTPPAPTTTPPAGPAPATP